jgi:predicted phage baseplate assembly protein
LNKPDIFNLLLLYSPQSGSQGVTLPVILEQFNNLSLKNIASQITSAAQLITVKTFEEGPSPSLSASDLMSFDASEAVPVIRLKGALDGVTTKWTVAPDLLGDGPDDTQFVVEIDTDGTAYLRFGDGTAGNVGANSLLQFAADTAVLSSISACTNPLSASGGIDPETNAQICRRAPQAFMTQERAITMQDYVNVTEQNPQIEDAAAVARWTGSWYTIFITAEPLGNANLTKPVLRSLYKTVNSYRLAGQDIYIEPPQYVSLKIVLAICVDPGYFRLDVEKALLQALGSGTLANGQPAYFAAQNFELGQTVYLSPIYEAARAVTGVQTVVAKVFEPQGQNTSVYLNQGYIPMNAFQVARLANDPSLPNHGQLKFKMQGGR